MLFKKRHKDTFWKRLCLYIWPRRSFSRSFLYFIKRILRISATPHAIALGLALGVFFGFSPFLGAHIILSMIFAWIFSANMVAAILGTAIANPFTLAFIWGGSYKLGRYLLGTYLLNDIDVSVKITHLTLARFIELIKNVHFSEIWYQTLEPLLLGSIVLGGIFATIVYFITFYFIQRFRKNRHLRLEKSKNNNKAKT